MLEPGRVGLAEPVVEVGVFHVLPSTKSVKGRSEVAPKSLVFSSWNAPRSLRDGSEVGSRVVAHVTLHVTAPSVFSVLTGSAKRRIIWCHCDRRGAAPPWERTSVNRESRPTTNGVRYHAKETEGRGPAPARTSTS